MPTLSFPSPGAALPMPIAINPIAAAPAGEGDAFAAMLEGMAVAPVAQPAVEAGPALKTSLETPTGLPLPQLRQDPAAWLPGEEDIAPAPVAPALTSTPVPPPGLIMPLDCEMPAYDLTMPQLEDPPAATAPDAVAVPIHTVPKLWSLRLSSALTPAGAAPKPVDANDDAPPETASADEKPGPGQEQQPPTPVQEPVAVPAQEPVPTPAAPVPVVSVAIALPSPAPSDPTSKSIRLTARAGTPSRADTAPRSARAEAIAAPGLHMPAAMAAPIAFHQGPRGDNQDQHPDARQPESQAKATPASERMAPDVARQVAQLVEQVTRPAPATAATDPIAVVMPTPTITAEPVATPAPPAPLGYQPAPVDLGRAEWVQAMVDRIAELPQAEGRREAQIQLLPDALGKVEVRIVERDDRLQVTLNADNAQARQLLSDAAPRLQELAEARGIRLLQTEVGGGQSQDRRSGHDQSHPQHPQHPQRPRSASAGRSADPKSQDDLIA